MTDDVQWELVGERGLENKAEAEGALGDLLDAKVNEMTIATIITHGDEGSANGTMI